VWARAVYDQLINHRNITVAATTQLPIVKPTCRSKLHEFIFWCNIKHKTITWFLHSKNAGTQHIATLPSICQNNHA